MPGPATPPAGTLALSPQSPSVVEDHSRDRSLRKRRPQWVLHVQAVFWRSLMQIGMFLHKLARPHPPRPHFSKHVQPSLSPRKDGNIPLRFWTPKHYHRERRKGPNGKQYPVVVTFHGGGFTLGEAMDDARWADAVVRECGAVVIGVDYRRGPERPFPTAVEDGVDALLWIVEHAQQYNLDPDRIAVSGFSAGGNMAFTVPLRLQQELVFEGSQSASPHGSSECLIQKPANLGRTLVNANKEIAIRAIVAWYPPCDYTQSRAQKKMTCMRLDQQLPDVFTRLFDESYLQPPSLDLSNPYLSPGKAPDHMLAGLPDDIVMFTCEWDMLLKEGEAMRDRLINDHNKNVVYRCVPGVPHAWDKAPNPLRVTPGVKEHYLMACKELNRVFGQENKKQL